MAVRGVPRPLDVIKNNDVNPAESDDDDDDEDAESLLDKVDLEGMSEKQKKLWEKKSTKWRLFLDFIFRHVSIVTFKFNCFERDEMLAFMIALDKAEGLRAQSKLRKGEQARVTSLIAMNKCSDILLSHNLVMESNRIRKYLDLAARIRGISAIALSFYKNMKKEKASGAEKLKIHIDIWRSMCLRSFDYTTLSIRRRRVSHSAVAPAPGTFEARFVCWPAALRSALWEAQRFLQRSSRVTGLSLISSDPLNTLQKHMQAAEYVLASHLSMLLSTETSSTTAATQQREAAIALLQDGAAGKSKNTQWELPKVDDVDPELLQAISENCIMLEIPADLPKEKKSKRRKGAKGGKKTEKKKSSGKKGKKKKKK